MDSFLLFENTVTLKTHLIKITHCVNFENFDNHVIFQNSLKQGNFNEVILLSSS